MDEEILQDFIVEAGEIIENLNEQLVQIEKTPDDKDLLNAIFRGFHTVKGGAGFLQLTNLVNICHAAESLFDELRNARIAMSPDLMDAVLQAYDEITSMFDTVKNAQQPDPAPQDLIDRLHALAAGGAAPAAAPAPAPAPEPEPEPEPAAPAGDVDDITEDEFEALLDQLHGKGHAPGADGDENNAADATDADFDKMLATAQSEAAKNAPKPEAAPTPAPAPAPAPAAPKPAAAPAAPAAAKPAAKPAGKADAAKSGPEVDTTVRVETQVLDDIMNLVGELVLVRNRLVNMASRRSDQDMSKAISNLDVVTLELQNSVMKTRMQPVKKVFGRFPRVVRDLARKLGKKIELRMEGEDTELDKNLVDALADPMVHMVRNCCDHGIEDPKDRVAVGKPETGVVLLRASQQGDHILLQIQDDGQGMDPDILRSVAVKKGLMDEGAADRLSDSEALNLIFAPGFSTNTEITDISGRGVGMDVVKTNISKLNGTVNVISTYGKGTTIEIKVPLTLAILPTLMISVSNRTFALPLTSVSEIFYLDLDSMRNVDGLNTIVIRDKAIPLFFLKQWFEKVSIKEYLENKAHIVLVQVSAAQLVGFVVDELLGQEEVVIKPLDEILRHTPGMAGATITSDGGIALILDIPGLMRAYAHKDAERVPLPTDKHLAVEKNTEDTDSTPEVAPENTNDNNEE
ncbi:chemotaxis protein CheA [uncultured Succinivibrio sp.]|uniref:chemotaxis protein CheA n=1 Tax=uncultured Succinivibrio sp. TaxID=540749 RepID=UPI0025F8A7CC|nr:chemotaxis protein CheA [uncultured Succinivibrio sp.]